MTAERELTGRRNKYSGQLFETMIERACKVYRESKIASIEKTPEPVKFLRRLDNGQFVACYEKKAQPDFKGILADGSCIVFDAKHTDLDKISQNAVSEEQAAFMDIYEFLGARCYIMVSMGFQSFYRVPWDDWKNMKVLCGHKYMSAEDLEPYGIPSRLYVGILEGIEIGN